MKYLNSLISKKKKESFQPLFYRLNNTKDARLLKELIKTYPYLSVNDTILGQIRELIKLKNPKINFTTNELNALADKHLKDHGNNEYGVWVYYPWSYRLVHILDEEEFIEVRTNRNQYKITPEEQVILAKQKIGIIGLSVGQSVSLTMAMERGFGEIRLADFDRIELSNLNRIRTGVHNLDVSKVMVVAREIAEIDPFLKVKCFFEGLTENNIHDFYTKDGKLDIVIDECDSIAMKIICRQKAKELQIPIVMEASDRGTIDIERFDLEPNRPLLHGFIDHLDIEQVKLAKTNEEKVPYLVPFVGLETISKRSKASMIEVGDTISTWPQLASDVTLGGSITANVCRRIVLNTLTKSGRFFVDIEEIITSDDYNPNISKRDLEITPPSSKEELLKLIRDFNCKEDLDQFSPNKTLVKKIVEHAIKAPSGANAQPWKWVYSGKTLYLFCDLVYTAKLLDQDKTTSYIGIGACIETLVLKAQSLGLEVKIEYAPLDKKNKLIAGVKFFKNVDNIVELGLEPKLDVSLAPFISLRTSNRNLSNRQIIKDIKLAPIKDALNSMSDVNFKIITKEAEIFKIAEIVAKSNRLRILNERGHLDFLAEIRWTPEEAELTKHGVNIATADLTPSEHIGLRMTSDWGAVKLLNEWEAGKAIEKFFRKSARGASAIGLITTSNYSALDFITGGRAAQRVWLAATKEKMAFNSLTAPTLLFNALNHGPKSLFSDKERKETEQMKSELINIFELPKDVTNIFLFKVFIAPEVKIRSYRMPVDSVLFFE